MSELMNPLHFDEKLVELRQGDYWRARRDLSNVQIVKGRIYLLKSIRDVHEEAHTVVLAGHPSTPGISHRFLVDEFLKHFEPVAKEEADAIRDRESAELQQKAKEKEQEMRRYQTDPQSLLPVLESEIRAWEVQQHVEPGTSDQARTIDPNSVSLAPTTTPQAVEQARLGVARRTQELTLISRWFDEKSKEIQKLNESVLHFWKEKAEAAIARTEDIRTSVERMQRGIETLDLYTLKDVGIYQIRKGKSADPRVKLHIQQSKLYVDEELVVWSEVGEFRRGRDFEKFYEALRENETLVNQIFPAERAIVCMATTRQHRDYSKLNPWVAARIDMEDKEVFLLVRDGENLYHVNSPVESHLAASRLFPSRHEMDEIFKERQSWHDRWAGKEAAYIPFQHIEYSDRMAEHEARALTYKRFLVLLAGLDERKQLFGAFHDNPPGSMAFFGQRFQAERMVFLHDDEFISRQIAGEVHESLDAYVDRNNKLLRSGSRVICEWDDVIDPKTAEAFTQISERSGAGRGYWIKPEIREKCSVSIAFVEEGDICVKAPLTWKTGRDFEGTIQLSKWEPGYYHQGMGYLVLDHVKAEDLDYYIHNRVERKEFMRYIRLFKAAMKFLREEAESQRESRDTIIRSLEEGGIASGPAAVRYADEAITTWRSAHRGALIPTASGPGFRQLLNQAYEMAQRKHLVENAEAVAMSLSLRPLRLTVTGTAKLTLYAAPKPEELDDRLFPHAWVHRLSLKRTKRGLIASSDVWAALPENSPTETTLQEWPDAADWAKRTPLMTYERKQQLFRHLEDVQIPFWLEDRRLDDGKFGDAFLEWQSVRKRLQAKTPGKVANTQYRLPIALLYADRPHPRGEHRQIELLALVVDTEEALCFAAPDQHRKSLVIQEYSRIYVKSETARQRLVDATAGDRPDIKLTRLSVEDTFSPLVKAQGYYRKGNDLQSVLAEEIEEWRRDRQRGRHIEDPPVEISVYVTPTLESFGITSSGILEKITSSK